MKGEVLCILVVMKDIKDEGFKILFMIKVDFVVKFDYYVRFVYNIGIFGWCGMWRMLYGVFK